MVAHCLLGLFLLGVPGLARRASLQEDSQEIAPDIAVQFDGSFYEKVDKDGTMTITRQNATLYADKPGLFNFSKDMWHKEFVVTLPPFQLGDSNAEQCDQPVFVKGEALPGICGTGLFTTPGADYQTCDVLAASETAAELSSLAHLQPPTDRGFSFEFEFVAREMSKTQAAEVDAHIAENYGPNIRRQRRNYDVWSKVQGVRLCFDSIIASSSRSARTCSKNTDCHLSEYCLDCAKAPTKGACSSDSGLSVCHPRHECEDSTAVEGYCPASLARWNFETDASVVALSSEQAEALGAGIGETNGVAFEVTAPGPPNVLSGKIGFTSTMEMLMSLRHLGIQAGPSQGIHLHVNVLSSQAPGTVLSHEQVLSVWAAYAKYQLVIDEMLSPGRLGNRYANRLYLGNCPIKSDKGKCNSDPCGCTKLFFSQMHSYLRSRTGNESAVEFCNRVLAAPGSSNPCEKRYPHQRYFQVNLVPLNKFGTLEFRAHSATYDLERVARWAQFLIAFVEHFGPGEGSASMSKYFATGTWEDGYEALKEAQREATAAELFAELAAAKSPLDADAGSFYTSRKWEAGQSVCSAPEEPKYEVGRCKPEADDFITATLVSQEGDTRTMKVQVVGFLTRVQETVTVMLPEGDTWAVKLKWRSTGGGYSVLSEVKLPHGEKVPAQADGSFVFSYSPIELAKQRFESTIQQHHRCCCDEGEGGCLWYPEDMLSNGHCPRLLPASSGVKGEMCVSSSRCSRFSSLMGNEACGSKTQHSRRRGTTTKCRITEAADAYFRGGRC